MRSPERTELLLIALPPGLQEGLAALWLRAGGETPWVYPSVEAARSHPVTGSENARWAILGQADPAELRQLRARVECERVVAQLAPEAPADRVLLLHRAGADAVIPATASLGEWEVCLENLRPAGQGRERAGQLVVVCGVTGGCGATTLALEMARELAQCCPGPGGATPGGVMLIEIPTRLGALGTLLNLDPTLTSHDLLSAGARLRPDLLAQAVVRVGPNLEVLIGPFRELPPLPASARALRQLLGLAQQRAGVVLVDLPCSFDDVLFETLGRASQTVLVGVQSVSSMRALRLVRDVMVREEGTAAPTVVINRYDPHLVGFEAPRLEELLGGQPLLTVPSDLPALMAAVGANQPLHVVAPHSGLRRGVRAIVLPFRAVGGVTPNAPTLDGRLRPLGPRPLRVLHIEDDAFQQQIVRLHLAALPAYDTTVVAVDNEQSALKAFRGEPFDLVLLDYHLSEGNGLACLRRLRELDAMVPILVISGLTEPHVAAELLEGGADDFLSKENLVGDRLARTLTALLARSDGIKARLPLNESEGGVSQEELELLRHVQRIRDALQDQPFPVGRVQRVVDRLISELQVDGTAELPRKELLEFFLRLLARHEEPGPPGVAPSAGAAPPTGQSDR